MELREKITKAIERAMLEDTGRGVGVQCIAAGYVLAIPEIAEALGRSKVVRLKPGEIKFVQPPNA